MKGSIELMYQEYKTVVEPLNTAQPNWKNKEYNPVCHASLKSKWINWQKVIFAVKRKALEDSVSEIDASKMLDVARSNISLKIWIKQQPGVKESRLMDA